MTPISHQQAKEVLERHEREVADRLHQSQAKVDRLLAELAEAKSIRLAVIEEAIGEGWSQAKVGRALGLTRQRVAQIRAADGTPKDNGATT